MNAQDALILTTLIIGLPAVTLGFVWIAWEWRQDADEVSRALLALGGLVLCVLAFWLTQFPGSPFGVINY